MWEYDYIVCIKEIISKKPQEAESIQEKKIQLSQTSLLWKTSS